MTREELNETLIAKQNDFIGLLEAGIAKRDETIKLQKEFIDSLMKQITSQNKGIQNISDVFERANEAVFGKKY